MEGDKQKVKKILSKEDYEKKFSELYIEADNSRRDVKALGDVCKRAIILLDEYKQHYKLSKKHKVMLTTFKLLSKPFRKM